MVSAIHLSVADPVSADPKLGLELNINNVLLSLRGGINNFQRVFGQMGIP
jgi:hypothetical protein